MVQILPYYVVEVAGSIPGISGLFIAGIFSAALSTMSASLNTVAGTIYEDFIKQRYVNFSDCRTSALCIFLDTHMLLRKKLAIS